jgi:hypothetical protein
MNESACRVNAPVATRFEFCAIHERSNIMNGDFVCAGTVRYKHDKLGAIHTPFLWERSAVSWNNSLNGDTVRDNTTARW